MKTTTTLLATLALTGTTAFGADLLVPSAYPTIQDAIDSAVDGDRVMIAPGTYYEAITVTSKQIVVRSEDRDPESVTIDASALGGFVVQFFGTLTSEARLIGVTITGGSDGTGGGGGILINDGDVRIRRCIIRENAGIGIIVVDGSPEISQCLIYDNTDPGTSGLYLSAGTDPTLTNCVIAHNSSDLSYPSITVLGGATMRNCIVGANDGDEQIADNSGLLDAQHCNIEGGWPGTGNIDVAPGFVDGAARDFRLRDGSACIDAGDSSAIGAAEDLASLPRKLDDPYAPNTGNGGGPIVDMGAYEYPSRVRYVNDDATGAGTGLTWDDAFSDLMNAIEDAHMAGSGVSELWVAAGIYHPDRGTGNRDASFELLDGMTWYGGFAGGEDALDDRDPDAHESVLSGAIGASGTADNSKHVVEATSGGAVGTIDGFIVQKGNADGSFGGGGMFLDGVGSTWTVRDCWIRQNEEAGPLGGGAAGVYCRRASCTFEATRIIGNTGEQGGGVRVDDGFAVLVSCVIAGNESTGPVWAAGLAADDANVSVFNCTIYGNEASGAVGGVHAGDGSIKLVNSILGVNSGASAGTLLERNYKADGAAETVSYSTIEGAGFAFGNEGNSPLPPGFVDLPGPNGVIGDADDRYDLRPGSQSIDSGHNAAILGHDLDLRGGTRRRNDAGMPDTGEGAEPIVDRGAVEFQEWSCAFDIDGDGTVGFNDLTILLGTWGDTGGDPTGDYLPAGGDGSLGFDELVNLLGTWGPCPAV